MWKDIEIEYLRLLVWLPVGKPNYSKACLKGISENIFQVLSTRHIVLQGSHSFSEKKKIFIEPYHQPDIARNKMMSFSTLIHNNKFFYMSK